MAWELKGNNSLWVYFLQEIQSLVQGLRSPIGVHPFHQLPAIKFSCQISCNSPRFLPSTKNECVEEGTGAKGGTHQRTRCGSVPSCCYQNRSCACWQHTCKGWAFQHFLLAGGVLCFGCWGRRNCRIQTDKFRTFAVRTTFCLCCMGKDNEILDMKALCHWSSAKWIGLWAHPNKKSASAFWLEQILALSLTFWGF